MVENSLKAFKSMLRKNTWMDEESRSKALNKADFLEPQVAYPDYYFDLNYVANNFKVKKKTI